MTVDLDRLQHAVETIPWVDRARVSAAGRGRARRHHGTDGGGALGRLRAAEHARRAVRQRRRDARAVGAAAPVGSRGQRSGQLRSASSRSRAAAAGSRPAHRRAAARRARRLGNRPGQRRDRASRPAPGRRADRSGSSGTAAGVIAHRVNDIAYVDMRYSNGFAIGWRTAAAPMPAAAMSDEAGHRGGRNPWLSASTAT